MSFEPVALTDPTGKNDDIVVETAVDFSNALYRDGYVRAEAKTDAVESESVEPEVAAPSPSPAARNKRGTVGKSVVVGGEDSPTVA